MNSNNLCSNCKYFNRHYVIRKAHLKKTAFGHCFYKARLHICTEHEHCDSWEQADGSILDKNIEEELKDMAKQINDIFLILNSD